MSDKDLIKSILQELDNIFDGAASANAKSISFKTGMKNLLSKAPMSLMMRTGVLQGKLGKSVDQRLFFAGDAYTDGMDWGSVHTAIYSAKEQLTLSLITKPYFDDYLRIKGKHANKSILVNVCTKNLQASQQFYTSLFLFDVNFDSDWYIHLTTPNAGFELGIIIENHEVVPKGIKVGAHSNYLTFVLMM